MARSPLDDRPPATVQAPRWSGLLQKFVVNCPNGEKLEFSSREAAWKAYYRLKAE